MFESVPAGETSEVSYKMIAPVRGVHSQVTYRLSGGDPFGLLRLGRKKTGEYSMAVFPRVSGLQSFPIVPEGMLQVRETAEFARKGSGQDFLGVREYREGDSLKDIHWRSTARRGALVVKEYQKEISPTTGLVIHLASPRGSTVYHNSLEDGLRAVASLVNYCYAVGSPPVLIVPGEGGWVGLEPATLWSTLEVLAAYRPRQAGDWDLIGGLTLARHAVRGPGTLIVVSNGRPTELSKSLVSDYWGLDSCLVWVSEGSYQGADKGRRGAGEDEGELVEALRGALNLYVIEADRDIGSCLKEPATTIAE